MAFNAKYYDGESSKTYSATIDTNTHNWNIIFVDDFNKSKKVIWKIDNIKNSEVYTKDLISFSYGNSFPFQKLESNDLKFIAYTAKSNRKNITSKLDTFLHKSVKKSIAILLTVIIAFSSLIYFYALPSVAINFAKNLPKQGVVKFGDYIFDTLSPNLIINDKLSEKLQLFVNALQLDSEFPITVYVAESEELNAFALSGGKFVIYTSLLKKIKNQHQLTALIGHEVSHIENRHVLKNVFRNLAGAMFVSIIFGDINAIASIIGENVHLFSQLSFTRSLEKEADIFGLEIMKRNNLNQNGMPELFEILNENKSTDNFPSFLNSHPLLNDRIEYTQNIANKQTPYIPNNNLKAKWNDLKDLLYLNPNK